MSNGIGYSRCCCCCFFFTSNKAYLNMFFSVFLFRLHSHLTLQTFVHCILHQCLHKQDARQCENYKFHSIENERALKQSIRSSFFLQCTWFLFACDFFHLCIAYAMCKLGMLLLSLSSSSSFFRFFPLSLYICRHHHHH